jgi:hypothetical protein
VVSSGPAVAILTTTGTARTGQATVAMTMPARRTMRRIQDSPGALPRASTEFAFIGEVGMQFLRSSGLYCNEGLFTCEMPPGGMPPGTCTRLMRRRTRRPAQTIDWLYESVRREPASRATARPTLRPGKVAVSGRVFAGRKSPAAGRAVRVLACRPHQDWRFS